MSDTLIIAVPSKGRLEENSAALFTAAGMKLSRTRARGYKGKLADMDNVAIHYLSAGEIATRLNEGTVHFGITGKDLLREEVPDLANSIQLVMPLGFGRANVVVGVPNGWLDVTRMADLAEIAAEFRQRNNKQMRVATKYIHLTADYFAEKGVQDIQIVKSFGATEGAPASGEAELIVDITSTGDTLAANDLRVLKDGIILKSEANLAAALKATWSPATRKTAKQILARLSAYQHTQNMLRINFFAPKGALTEADFATFNISRLQQFKSLKDLSLEGTYFDLLIDKSELQLICDKLAQKEIGVSVSKLDYYFSPRNELFDRLAGALI